MASKSSKSSTEPVFVPYLALRANRAVEYAVNINRPKYRRESIFSHINNIKQSISLYDKRVGMSYKASQRLKDVINTLVAVAKWKTVYSKIDDKYFRFKVNFITLTLSSKQMHTDKEVYKEIFKPFIRQIRSKFKNLLYLWKAEVQDNGNLHFHLTTNTFIRWDKLRALWNAAQERLGYISRSNINNPNSTDVHATKGIKNLAAYLSGYMSKKDMYTKPLKRYFKRYKKILNSKSHNEGVEIDGNTYAKCVLPRSYFTRLKRHISMRYWDCSKCLHRNVIRIECPSQQLLQEVDQLASNNAGTKKFDYCSVTYYQSEHITATKAIKEVWKLHMAALYAMNSADVINADLQ